MAYLGLSPAVQTTAMDYQDLTGGTGTGFTLDHPVANASEIEVFVNNVRQEPTVAYTVAGTSLTMTGSIVATDDFYVVFQGKALVTSSTGGGDIVTCAAKGWTNFNMVTPVINDSYNTSSITDVTSGQFHVLHTNNMSNTTYAPTGVSNNYGGTTNFGGQADTAIGIAAGSLTLGIATTGYGFATYDSGYVDAAQNQSVVHGDLA